jgi:hypothetical protein
MAEMSVFVHQVAYALDRESTQSQRLFPGILGIASILGVLFGW